MPQFIETCSKASRSRRSSHPDGIQDRTTSVPACAWRRRRSARGDRTRSSVGHHRGIRSLGRGRSVPYIVVTNLARTMRDLKDKGIWLIGADDTATESIYKAKIDGAVGMVLGAEGRGCAAHKESCDPVSIPMRDVDSLMCLCEWHLPLRSRRRRFGSSVG